MNAQEPREATQPEPVGVTLSKDMMMAQSVSDVIEIRKQETRRRVTYSLVGTFCGVVAYCTVFVPEMRSEALTALTAGAAAAYAFYFASKQREE